MNNLWLWGYDRSSLRSHIHDIQQSRLVNTGLIEKLNQLKTNIQELTTQLQNKINIEDIASLELEQQQIETSLHGHLDKFETLQQNLAEISSSFENFGTAERAAAEGRLSHRRSAAQAHEDIMKNLNLY